MSTRLLLRRVTLALGLAGAFAIAAPGVSSAQPEVAHTAYFEGVPLEDALDLDATDVEALIAVLDDPAQANAHAGALEALGMSGSHHAFPALVAYASRGRSGEIDRAEYRALRALPLAMGHLARDDDRALRWLIRRVTTPTASPQRSFRHMGPERLDEIELQSALAGLGLSGRDEAGEVLVGFADSEGSRGRVAREAADLRARIDAHGAAAVLGARQGRSR